MNNLEGVRYELGIAEEHYDERRNLDDPLRLFEGLEDGIEWHPHAIITIKNSDLYLANHHHDFDEVYFTPNGCFEVWLSDAVNPTEGIHVWMAPGSRLFIPKDITHRVRGDERSVLLTYGSVLFDPKRMIKSSEKALKVLDDMIS